MRMTALIVAAAAAAWAFGCGGHDKPKVVKLLPPSTTEAQPEPAPKPTEALAPFFEAAPVTDMSDTVFLASAEAPRCPEVAVNTSQGKEVRLGPGTRGFAEAGYVTLIVFWDAGGARGPLAAQHVSDLAKKYAQWRVRAVGIVEMVGDKKVTRADQIIAFANDIARRTNLAMGLYFDDMDMSALAELSSAAGAKEDTAVPSILIVDRKMRLRFYRAGFRFGMSGTQDRRTGARAVVITETAPEKQRVEDYLQTVLREED